MPSVVNGSREITSLNESPSQKEGKSVETQKARQKNLSLNESPSQKEGKYADPAHDDSRLFGASMKVPPKRKGNASGAHGVSPSCSGPQ